MSKTHSRRAEVFSRITSSRFSGVKGNTGKGLGIQGKTPQRVKPTGSPLQQSRNVSSLSPPQTGGKYVHQCAPVIRKPPEPRRVGTEGPAPHQLGEGEMGSKCLMINGFLLGGDEHVLELENNKAVFKNRHSNLSSE